MTGAGQTITALNNVAAGAGQAAGALNSLFSNSYNSALHQQYQYKNAPQFDVGGYTGDGPRNQPAGVVHKGEYVVPQNGTLVTRGDNVQTVEVLSRMLRVLERIEAQGPGTLNATIYTNQPTVSTKTLTNIDKAYARG
jgi:hypothetical protein